MLNVRWNMLSLADRNQAELIIVHVANIVSAISNFDQTPISGGYVSEQIPEDMEETGKEILNDVGERNSYRRKS